MPDADRSTRGELLRGSLEMLILQTLTHGAIHGYGIAQHLTRVSKDVLRVEEGSLYPALQRLLVKGLVTAEWRRSPNNQRARCFQVRKGWWTKSATISPAPQPRHISRYAAKWLRLVNGPLATSWVSG